MPTTSNFGWTTPADTDLVKDGAAAIRTLGNGIDTSMAQLKGGTTGQVLSKTSATDMAFTWVTQDDANAIQNAIVDAKGDLIAATANDTPARLAVGNNGETLVADSSATTGLRWQGNYSAGKNAIINGDFRFNQRAFTSNTTTGSFNYDRFLQINSGSSGTLTVVPQTFTPGLAPAAPYEGLNHVRATTASGASTNTLAQLSQRVESVRTFANQNVTVSFWAKATSGTPSINVELEQNFGSGGSSTVYTAATKQAITTGWVRYSWTITVPTISGKTIGNNNYLGLNIWLSAGSTLDSRSGTLGLQNNTFDIWGIQLEQGNTATAFQTATGSIQGELAACQRYYLYYSLSAAPAYFFNGVARSTTVCSCYFPAPVEMRIVPTSIDVSGFRIFNLQNGTAYTGGTTALEAYNNKLFQINYTHGTAVFTTGTNILGGFDATSSYIGFSAEL